MSDPDLRTYTVHFVDRFFIVRAYSKADAATVMKKHCPELAVMLDASDYKPITNGRGLIEIVSKKETVTHG